MQFHTLYAVSLSKSAIKFIEMNLRQNSLGTKRLDEMSISDVENKNYLTYNVREKLQIFLQTSDLYDPEVVLKVIEGTELWLEKAILYRKMGLENLVLEILALKLEDCDAAEQYCAEIGRNDAYMQLLDMYLDPQDGKEPMFKAAVRLLHNHGESLDPLRVLEKLSPKMPLQLAADTVLRMLRARVHHHQQGQIVHNLSRAIHLDAQLARLEERSRNVQINEESVCDSCHARLGTKLFAMYPDDSIVCYKCYRRLGESTSARGHDFKQNPILKSGWLIDIPRNLTLSKGLDGLGLMGLMGSYILVEQNAARLASSVGMIGILDNHVATSFGNHLVRPIMRSEWHEDMNFEGAEEDEGIMGRKVGLVMNGFWHKEDIEFDETLWFHPLHCTKIP
ncbi:hypothetical protein HPP92_023436 [Vanilla planifolia]|uniref:Vacuolar sorting protein 39/Transforming growth factor beta receptor-associated zinc finger domain-containing protein n=1 Tax=Vanilla planifolia TaxID=51239 RepID=A0A835Q0A9_VANPL|nr:hypothetical protein HPP92_023436 [Vanilla planifolia]